MVVYNSSLRGQRTTGSFLNRCCSCRLCILQPFKKRWFYASVLAVFDCFRKYNTPNRHVLNRKLKWPPYLWAQSYTFPTKAVWGLVRSQHLISNQLFAFWQPKNQLSARKTGSRTENRLQARDGLAAGLSWPTKTVITIYIFFFAMFITLMWEISS